MLSRTCLSEEHVELGRLAGELLAAAEATPPEPERLSRLRWAMNRLLTCHLAREDRLLYPRLRGGADPVLAALATQFAAEMGNLDNLWKAFLPGWSTERIAR